MIIQTNKSRMNRIQQLVDKRIQVIAMNQILHQQLRHQANETPTGAPKTT